MDSSPREVFLDVPVTDAERREAERRASQPSRGHSSERLLPDSTTRPPQSRSHSPRPLRFPSIHAPGLRNLPPLFPPKPAANEHYIPISPVEEDGAPRNAIPLRQHPRDGSLEEVTAPPPGPFPPLWTSIWLRQWVLALFAVTFILLLIGLLLLWHFDRKNAGFSVPASMSHDSWSYGPTIVVVFLVAAWRMVDYQTKAAMPFDSLQRGPIKASQGLLLDYVSKFQLLSLLDAFKRGHIPIIVTVTGFVLLKVVTVFSTGLLILLPTNMARSDVSVRVDTFSTSLNLDSTTFPPTPVYAYYGNVAQGLPLSDGVTLDFAYGTLALDPSAAVSLPANGTLSGEVDAFVPLMACKPINAKLNTPAMVNDTNANDAFATSSNISLIIEAGDACDQFSILTIPAENPYTDILPSRQVTGTMQEMYCSTTNASQVDRSQGPKGLLFTITDIRYQQDLFDNATALAGGSFTIASNVSRTLANMTNVFCTPSYVMSKVHVTNDSSVAPDGNRTGVSVTTIPKAGNTTLPDLSDWNVTSLFVASLGPAEAMLGDPDNGDGSAGNALLTLMALTDGTTNTDVLFNSSKMATAAEKTYKGILAQYAHQTLRSPSSDITPAAVTQSQERLRVNGVSLWTMVSCFALLAGASVALIFLAPRGVVPRDPSSIATMAMILTRSTELNRLFRRQGTPSDENQKSALAGFEFGTAIATAAETGRASFKVVTSEGEPDEPTIRPNMALSWWKPLTSSIPAMAITLISPIVIIIVLELLQRSSDRHHGLYTVADNQRTEIYSHYIPAVVMLVIAAFINALDFNVAMLAPWTNLAEGNAISKRSILNHLLGKSPPFALLQAFRTRYWGGLLSIVAAALASFLAVVVAGLYTVQHFAISGPDLSLTRLDDFHLQWPDSFSNDNGAAAMTDLIEHMNVSYPEFTYQGLVFPRFSIENSDQVTDALNTFVGSSTVRLPALRANLQCDILPSSSFNLSTQQAGSDSAYATDQAFVAASAALPDKCQLGGYQGNQSFVVYENNFELPEGGAGTYAGAQLDLLFGDNATVYGNDGEARGQYIGDNPPVGCPSLALTFGYFQLGSSDKSRVTTMICYQQIQQLEANLTLRANTTAVDAQHPPLVDESSVALLANPNSTAGVKSFDFRIQNNLAQQMTAFNGGTGTVAENPALASTYDIFFQAVLNGTDQRDPKVLAGPDNQDRLLDAINDFYRIYMAQAIHANMRGPVETSNSTRLRPRQSSSSTTLGQLQTTISTPRLVQDNSSKLALQVLLAVMTACAAVAYLTTKMRHVLPCNPCSIAGTMALLAGSDLCHSADDGLCECCGKPRRRSFGQEGESIHANVEDEDEDCGHQQQQLIPDGAEWMDDDAFERVFAGKRYSMGWWREQRHRGKRRRFGVDIGTRADGADDQDWELGDRRPEGEGFGDFMVRGDRDGRGRYGRFEHSRGPSGSPDPAGRDTARGRGRRMSGISAVGGEV